MSEKWNSYLESMDQIKNYITSIASKDELIRMPKSVVKFIIKLLDALKTKFQEINARLSALEGG